MNKMRAKLTLLCSVVRQKFALDLLRKYVDTPSPKYTFGGFYEECQSPVSVMARSVFTAQAAVVTHHNGEWLAQAYRASMNGLTELSSW